jgi:hypothetical protein
MFCCLSRGRYPVKGLHDRGTYECETLSLTLREEHSPSVFETSVLRITFRPKRDEVTGVGENCIIRSFVTCTVRQV